MAVCASPAAASARVTWSAMLSWTTMLDSADTSVDSDRSVDRASRVSSAERVPSSAATSLGNNTSKLNFHFLNLKACVGGHFRDFSNIESSVEKKRPFAMSTAQGETSLKRRNKVSGYILDPMRRMQDPSFLEHSSPVVRKEPFGTVWMLTTAHRHSRAATSLDATTTLLTGTQRVDDTGQNVMERCRSTSRSKGPMKSERRRR